MFKNALNINQGLEWLRSLFHPGDDPRACRSELFVPDGCMALRIQDGLPQSWLEPGRHLVDAQPSRTEMRLVPSELARGADRLPLDQAMDLPFERALLFLDGRHIATLIPGAPVRPPSASRPRPEPSQKSETLARPARVLEAFEEEWAQDCSFV